MGLTKYKQKRNFKETPEPKGGTANGNQLIFVVQKHNASHLHYDLRLEMEGVLKSWAVPKGPSLDPSVKRLAMLVEDHPFDYRNFEGIIPSGYGAGSVIVWDQGFYETLEADKKNKKEQDTNLRHALNAGKLHFILKGKKLKGEFALVKTKGGRENSWLLMKIKDMYASTEDITLKDRSVLSKKTLSNIKATSANLYREEKVKESKEENKKVIIIDKPSNKILAKKPEVKKISAKKKTAKKKFNKAFPFLKKIPSLKFTDKLSPMLAKLIGEPFDSKGWIYEVKWDGYRAVAFMNKGIVELKSRNDNPFNEKFYPVFEAITKWGINAIVDGEIVVVNDKGISDFGALQNWRSEADGPLLYYLFDLLWLDGKDLRKLPLIERKKILHSLIPDEGIIRLSENFEGSGKEFFNTIKEMGLEGMIAKKADSVYQTGLRSDDWLKIKANKRQEMVIGGYTKNEDSRKPFSSLLVGVFDHDKLVYTGKIGTGFNLEMQKQMLKEFKPLITKKNPFQTLPDINKPSRFRPDQKKAEATWLKPELVCEVSFTEMTNDKVMRHPSFEGMRIDKKAKKVILETPDNMKDFDFAVPDIQFKTKKNNLQNIIKPAYKKVRKTLLNPTDETQVRIVNKHPLKFTNLSKIYWPDNHITKRDLLNYYYQAAPYILPYLKNRPQSLNRHPNGINGAGFYQKDVTGKVPDWIETYKYHSKGDANDRHFLVCTDEASLLYMVSLGCIELNPWSSKTQTPDNPDWCIIDLDPDKNSFDQVITAAQITHQILESMKIPSFCKTSGSTGIHIYIPLGAKYTFDQSKEFARIIVSQVYKEIPGYTSMERMKSKRGNKMYLDFLQNRPQATIAAPYSLRPKPGATVSMPLHWDEVRKGLKMSDFTIFNAIDRLKKEGDIFKPVLGKGINLEKIVLQF